jgi:glycerol-3-phosphate dehydrogenase
MTRSEMIARLREDKIWDIIVIGGGATGLGIAIDAAARGYSVLLLEKFDFAKGTSSRSTKLVHGGVRYLAQGNIKLVREALRERGILLKILPENKPLLFHPITGGRSGITEPGSNYTTYYPASLESEKPKSFLPLLY